MIRLGTREAKHPPGEPMTLGNMRKLGVQRLVASCLNPRKVTCNKCGARGRHIDVRPNWKEQPPRESLTGKEWR
jgi:hypothetical protein